MIDLPPPGFRGLDPDRPVRIYRRHLPHWRQDGATYFVTFRLADSLPRARLDELEGEKKIWERRHPDPSDAEQWDMWRRQMEKIEDWLDQGHGSCVLQDPEAAVIAETALHHFDEQRYALFARIVMPNHVHVVLRPSGGHALEQIIESWKKWSSRQIHAWNGEGGRLWQREYYDRIVRDAEELRRVIRYLEKNERQIGGRRKLWLTPAWAEWLNGRGV